MIGTAFQNPDGSIGFGLNIVSTPGGLAVPVDADIALRTAAAPGVTAVAAPAASC